MSNGSSAVQGTGVEVKHLEAWYGKFRAFGAIDLNIEPRKVTAIIGPSGCGKSTLIRCLNRMHETVRGAYVRGQVLVDGQDLYAPGVDPVLVRRRIGMVFQKPNPFPTMSVFDNAAAGIKLNGLRPRQALAEVVEKALRQAALWDEVRDKLHQSGTALSGGQQQRLCIARALAVEPEVLLMDEPCSALDPVATTHIEDLISELKERYTIIIVTHNMQQASRVSDMTAFMLANPKGAGELIEYGVTGQMFTDPKDERTEAYIEGRFG
ncbi:MAG: phosphate ABC transporter ATP-binding protein PstB [Dehalococcoidia bacterium]|nr:phosphate ABC transporter ATP-binding protein PstB [Dehalococcoidia bacterium]